MKVVKNIATVLLLVLATSSIAHGVMQEDVYKGLITLPKDEQQVWRGVYAVNTHTKRYITEDLTDFVNNEVWSGSFVPFEWARVSAIMGEDTSGWNVCDSS